MQHCKLWEFLVKVLGTFLGMDGWMDGWMDGRTDRYTMPQILTSATETTQHPFDTKAKETKLNCLNTFGYSKITTNLLPSSGESLRSADLITTLATNVIYVVLRSLQSSVRRICEA